MAAIASTSTPQSMLRTDLDSIHNQQEWTPLSPSDSSQQQQRRIMLPPIRTLLNEQLARESPPPVSASSTSSNAMRLKKLHKGATSPLDDRFENPLPSPVSSQLNHNNKLNQQRRPLIPSHSSASPLMDMHDCILNQQLRREHRRRKDHRLPHSSSTSTSSSPYDYGRRRPSLTSSSHSSSYHDSNSEVVPSPTTTSTDFSSQRAASWVSQFSLQMSMNNNNANNNSSPLVSPISSTSSGNYVFPGPLDTRGRHAVRHDTNETIKETDCSPVYQTTTRSSSSTTSPPPPQSPLLQNKKPSCALASKRLWELPLCFSK